MALDVDRHRGNRMVYRFYAYFRGKIISNLN